MAQYEELAKLDILTPIRRELDAGSVKLHPDGSIKPTGEVALFPEAPWITANYPMSERNCALWSRIYYERYGILSRNCFHCFKVVVRPKNLDDLFAILDLQAEMSLPAKCGIETRPWATHKGLYAAFWYCPMEGGLEGAREHHKLVEKAVHNVVGYDTKVILKRACTEQENAWGPSDEWIYPEEQHRFEDLLDASWDINIYNSHESTALKITRRLDWIDHARRGRDKTAEKYYDSFLTVRIVSTVTYHDVAPEIKCMPDRGERKERDFAQYKEEDYSHPAGLSQDK